MCEIFGASLCNNIILNEYLKTFYSHSDMHPHGWGLACMEQDRVSIEKEPVCASKSRYLKQRLTAPVKSKTVLAHIRYATIGNVLYQNCHPYSRTQESGRCWTMIHNGTIFEFEPLNKYVKRQDGDTDSERILMYILDCMNQEERKQKKLLTAEERFAVLDGIVSDMAKGNKLNLLLYDGELLYAHTNFAGSLHYLMTRDGVLFSTQPLSEEAWQPLPFTTLLAFCDGKMVLEGHCHGHEYVESEENLKYLYQIFSEL